MIEAREIEIFEYKIARLTKKKESIEMLEKEPDWESLGLPNPNGKKKNKFDKIQEDYDINYEWGKKSFIIEDVTTVEEISDEETYICLNYDIEEQYIIKKSFKETLKLIYNKEE